MSTHTTGTQDAFGESPGRAPAHRTWDAFILFCCLAWFVALFATLAQQAAPLPDFSRLDTPERKQAFFDYLGPLVSKINNKALDDRAFVGDVIEKRAAGQSLSWLELRRVESLAASYEADGKDANIDAVLATLDRRIGVIPPSLVLVQAAVESGWGTSRFAVAGNNLFGQRCYEDDCGIEPLGRDGAAFGVAKFDSVQSGIENYALNLNTHPQYRAFRDLRQRLRATGAALKGLDLAQGLLGYSERGQVYVDEIRSMIRQNGLE